MKITFQINEVWKNQSQSFWKTEYNVARHMKRGAKKNEGPTTHFEGFLPSDEKYVRVH